jgi:hypothetical protein
VAGPDCAPGALAHALGDPGRELRRERRRGRADGYGLEAALLHRRGAALPVEGHRAGLPPALLPAGFRSRPRAVPAAGGQSEGGPLLVPRAVSAGRAAGCGFALERAGPRKARRALHGLQSLPDGLPGRRRPHPRRAVAQGRMPPVHELCGRLSGIGSGLPFLPFAGGHAQRAGLAASSRGGRPVRRRGAGAADARHAGLCGRNVARAHPAAGRA